MGSLIVGTFQTQFCHILCENLAILSKKVNALSQMKNKVMEAMSDHSLDSGEDDNTLFVLRLEEVLRELQQQQT